MNNIKFDASKLLHANGVTDRFIHNLDVSDYDMALLLEARKLGRRAIRIAFKEAGTQLLLEESLRESGREPGFYKAISPAFWPQGSGSYGTMNHPAYNPPQQIDLDDGVYLPMDMFEGEPIYAKKVFFKIVDTALESLALQKGWKFVSTKDTCARLEINALSHLDFPLYAMPLDRFEELKKNDGIVLDSSNEEYQFSETATVTLDPNDVYLATRGKDHWVKSDPKLIENWFRAKKEEHNGRRLTRVSRFIKAWRDFTWEKGGPSSLVLMTCVVDVFDKSPLFDRDCEAILAVSKKLPLLLSGEIFNPALPLEADPQRLFPSGETPAEIDEIVIKANELHSNISHALISAKSNQEVVDKFIESFGGRIPNRSDYVNTINSSVAKTVLGVAASEQVRKKIPVTKSA